jgi:cobalt-zinc-cadmium efflux system membrane fusion protein
MSEQTRAAAAAAPAGPGLLRIDPGMLRDLRMTTAAVERRTSSAEVDMLGEVGVDRERYAEVAPPIDAQVVRLLVPVNAVVRQGQRVAELRSPELGRARAGRITADARARLAAQTLERKRLLAAERIVPARELQEAESQLQEAEAEQRAATATLRALGATAADDAGGAEPSQFFLHAPLGGTVLERSAVTGQLAQSAQAMYRIADLRRVWLTVHAFERDAVQLARYTPVRITLAATPGRVFTGTVAAIGNQVDAASRTFDVRIELANTDGVLRPGMSATAHVPIQAGDRQLLAVPAAAVQRVGEEWLVFLPRDPGVFELRRIGRGRDLGTEVEVVSGLDGTETVVVDGAFLLKAEAEKTVGGDDHEHEE